MSNPGAQVATTNAYKPAVSVGRRQYDLDQTFRLAQAFAQSKLIPESLRGKPSDVLVTIMYGQELNLAPMQAMQAIHVIKGKPGLAANLWVALARKAGHKVRVLKETATSCEVSVTRNDDPDEPTVVEYTLEDARIAGLLSNDNYKKNPKAMYYARAASIAVRRACPEVALGFVDEYEMHEPEPERPTLAQVAAQRGQADTDAPVDAEIVPDPPNSAATDQDYETEMLAELAAIENDHTGSGDTTSKQDELWFEGGDNR